MTLSAIADFTRPENWTSAQPFANALGPIPSSFTTTIRTLITDGAKSPTALSPGGRFLMTRFVKIPGMRAPFYFAALTFHKDMIGKGYISPADLVKAFGSHEMAGIIGLLYLYRRARKLCDPEEWAMLAKNVNDTVEIGGHLGLGIPNIGPGLGMLVAGTPLLAHAAFIIKDKKGYKEYRRSLKSKGVLYDLEAELSRWKTSCVHIAAVFLQSMGVGVQIANAFVGGIGAGPTCKIDTDPEAYRLYIAARWIEELRKTGAAPDMTHKGQYYPLKQDLAKLVEEVESVLSSGSKFSWLEKNKESISPELTPQLFKEGEVAQADDFESGAVLPKKLAYDELPAEVRELFSKEEIEQMPSAELEDILRQAEAVEDIG